jgi:hypothetical protein
VRTEEEKVRDDLVTDNFLFLISIFVIRIAAEFIVAEFPVITHGRRFFFESGEIH